MTSSILQRLFRRTTRPTSAWSRARWTVAAAALALALAATSAVATIVNTTGSIIQLTPNDVRVGHRESDTWLIAFDEAQSVWLPVDVTTDLGILPAGTCVNSHFIHGDSKTTAVVLSGEVRFQTDILGVISDAAGLDLTDGPLGKVNVKYPNHPVPPVPEPKRGLEPADAYTISPGGRAIEVTLDVHDYSDQLRVLTSCP